MTREENIIAPGDDDDTNMPDTQTKPDFELISDVRRSIAKIFNNILINEGKHGNQAEILSQENERREND